MTSQIMKLITDLQEQLAGALVETQNIKRQDALNERLIAELKKQLADANRPFDEKWAEREAELNKLNDEEWQEGSERRTELEEEWYTEKYEEMREEIKQDIIDAVNNA